MNQRQNVSFLSDNYSKRAGLNNEKPVAVCDSSIKDKPNFSIMIRNKKNNSVKYFDLVAENSNSQINGQSFFNKKKEELCSLNTNKISGFIPLQNSVSNSPLPLPSTTDAPKKLFYFMLVYLDRLLYLDELSENLKDLENAFRAGNIKKVISITDNCIDICLCSGMYSLSLRLRRLVCLGDKIQLADADVLIWLIRKEYERCRFELNKSLDRMEKPFQKSISD